jgi:hypothetical protein
VQWFVELNIRWFPVRLVDVFCAHLLIFLQLYRWGVPAHSEQAQEELRGATTHDVTIYSPSPFFLLKTIE